MAFGYFTAPRCRGLPFDRHQPVRQMNGTKAAPFTAKIKVD
jgi:hypothetical protein